LGKSGLRDFKTFFVIATLLASMQSISAIAQSVSPMPDTWQSTKDLDHPLVGSVIDMSSGSWLGLVQRTTTDAESLVRKLDDTTVVLLGETHDNPDHHVLRRWAINQIISLRKHRRGVVPDTALVFEQLSADQKPALDKFELAKSQSEPPVTLDAFKAAVDWDKSGWAKYNYDPLFQAAIDAKLPIYAGDVTRDAIMKVAKDGEAALSAEDRAHLKLDLPLGPKLDAASLTEIEEAHCNTMPKEALGGMAFAQRYRDASLADAVLKAAEKHGSAILIAGNGHVRTDRGVPWYIHQRDPSKKVVSVMLIEVEDGKNEPEAYVPRDPDGKPAADYIIFTPGVADRPDPCEKMRAKTRQ
jgi:uncharacterized iron-regulated protein